MIAKNNLILTLLLLSLFLAALLAAVTLATVIILGYTGFSAFNQKENLLQLESGCLEDYFTQKYDKGLHNSTRVSFICEFAAFGASIVGLMIVIAFVCGCQCQCFKSDSQRRSQTGLGDSQQNRNTYIQIAYPTTTHIIYLYILISILILAAFVPFKQYLQYLVEHNNEVCPIMLNATQIRAISILNGVMMSFGVLAMIFLVALNCRVQERLTILEMENRSQSFRHQIQRMIRQLPETERRFAFKNQDPVLEAKQEEMKFGSKQKSNLRSSPREEIDLSRLQKVESILYNANPSLRLQSAVNSD